MKTPPLPIFPETVTQQEVQQLLRGLPFLKPVSDELIADLATKVTTHHFTRGQPLCREGTPCGGIWIVKQGSIQTVRGTQGGRYQILDTSGLGETCALASALDGGSCPMQTEARTDTTAIFVPREGLEKIVASVPAVGIELAKYLGQCLRHATEKLSALCLKDVRSRVAAFLVEEATANGTTTPEGKLALRLPGSQEEIAHRIGTEREVFARALKSLRNDHVIEQTRDRVTVLDMDQLRARAAG